MKHSDSIISALRKKGVRFWANDNIADYLDLEDIEILKKETEKAFAKVLSSLLIDTETDPNSIGTAKRLSKMYWDEIFSGRYTPKPRVTAFPNSEEANGGDEPYTGMLVVRAELKSSCSHHWQPVTGVAYIGILPNEHVLGLSKYPRIAQHLARRGTLQEQLCQSIRKAISEEAKTENVGVYIQAEHGCCTNRGINAMSSLTQTTSLGGAFLDDIKVKEEFFHNIHLQRISK